MVKARKLDQLIGIKKVDLSVFKYGTHIPIPFHKYFEAANDGAHVDRGHSKDIKLIFDDKIFDANLRNIKRTNLDTDTLQLRYDNNTDLKEYLKNEFSLTYRITDIKKNAFPRMLIRSYCVKALNLWSFIKQKYHLNTELN